MTTPEIDKSLLDGLVAKLGKDGEAVPVDELKALFKADYVSATGNESDFSTVDDSSIASARPQWSRNPVPPSVLLYRAATRFLSSSQRYSLAQTAYRTLESEAFSAPVFGSTWHEQLIAFLLLIADHDISTPIRSAVKECVSDALTSNVQLKESSKTHLLQLLAAYRAFFLPDFWESFILQEDGKRMTVIVEGLAVHHRERALSLLSRSKFSASVVNAVLWLLPAFVEESNRKQIEDLVWHGELTTAPDAVVQQFGKVWRSLGFHIPERSLMEGSEVEGSPEETSTGLQHDLAWLRSPQGIATARMDVRRLLETQRESGLQAIRDIVQKARHAYDEYPRIDRVRAVNSRCSFGAHEKIKISLIDRVYRAMVAAEPLFWLSDVAFVLRQQAGSNDYFAWVSFSRCIGENSRLMRDTQVLNAMFGDDYSGATLFGELISDVIEKDKAISDSRSGVTE